jgi:hypothetical protein
MKHYILLKFRDGELRPDVIATIRKILEPLHREAGFSGVAVRANCADRDDNHDVMIEISMDSEGALDNYKRRPNHMGLINFAGPKVVSKVTFDCLDE